MNMKKKVVLIIAGLFIFPLTASAAGGYLGFKADCKVENEPTLHFEWKTDFHTHNYIPGTYITDDVISLITKTPSPESYHDVEMTCTFEKFLGNCDEIRMNNDTGMESATWDSKNPPSSIHFAGDLKPNPKLSFVCYRKPH